jgi:hypothetical protein
MRPQICTDLHRSEKQITFSSDLRLSSKSAAHFLSVWTIGSVFPSSHYSDLTELPVVLPAAVGL